MFISRRTRQQGWTLVEMMVSVAVFSVVALALAMLFLFSIRSFAAMYNYALLDQENRQTMDKLTKEIREANEVTSYTSNSLTILNGSGNTVTYTWSPPPTGTLSRNDGLTTQILLTNCALLNFYLYQKNPSNANWGVFPAATNSFTNTVKVVELTWSTKRAINPTVQVNSENVQTARIVLRNQH